MAEISRGVIAGCAGTLLVAVVLAGCASSGEHRDPRVALAQQQQAARAYDRGDMEHALAGYLALTQSMPQDTESWFRLGNVYAKLDQPDDAVTAYRHVLERDSNNARAWHNLGIMLMRQAQAALTQSAQVANGDGVLRDNSLSLASGLLALGHQDARPRVTASAAKSPVTAPASAPERPSRGTRVLP